MSTYRNNTTRTLTREEEQAFRNKANALCRAEKNYQGDRFGDHLEILEVKDAPIYQASLMTQHDRRTLHYTVPAPTSKRLVPTVRSMEEIDATRLADYPTHYIDREESVTVEGSHESSTCNHCGGKGTERCGRCNGTGQVTVEENCPYCHGKGFTQSTETQGGWEDPSTGKIYTSAHTGYKQVTRERTKTTQCTHCHGKGKTYHEERCPSCHGAGRVQCHMCQGKGMLERHIEMQHKQYVAIANRYVLPDLLRPADARELTQMLDTLGKGWTLCDKFAIEGTDFASCPAGALPVVGGKVREVTAGVASTPTDRVCFGTLSVSECPATAIRYRHAGKDYTAVLYGSEGTLFVATSPISDYFNGLRDDIEKKAEREEYGSSWKRLKQLVESSQGTAADERVLRQLEERLRKTALLGYFTGLSIMAFVLLAPLTYYFALFNFVAPWTELIYRFLYPPHADCAVRALVGLGIAFWTLKSGTGMSALTWQHESGGTRFLLGMLNGCASMLVATVVVCALNYLGLLHLIMLAALVVLGLITTAISLVIALVMLVVHLVR